MSPNPPLARARRALMQGFCLSYPSKSLSQGSSTPAAAFSIDAAPMAPTGGLGDALVEGANCFVDLMRESTGEFNFRLDASQQIAPPSENEEFTRDEEFWYEDGNVILVAQNVGFRVYRGFLAIRGKYMLENDAELDCLPYRIRLAQKYGIGDLLEEPIWQLKKLYPTTLSKWIDVQRHYSPRTTTAVNVARLTNTPSILPSASYVCCQLPNHDLLDGASHSDGTVESSVESNRSRL
ncbi:uncharacterized protein B0H18DRAFT_1102473 [Fomitopsis serialis]|uniref:uncharacterized protein n=1 Tax=Fomitopsis serialis TaxID=139415 RepID=UPI002008CA0B|nr:uncharacterized protein B0H18DRAFT_1102473 [Neoantrodia serialis]KAH9932341.1 hypothetical protein B0H18DRAFT_1102473 [Neoantrodia serialis]